MSQYNNQSQVQGPPPMRDRVMADPRLSRGARINPQQESIGSSYTRQLQPKEYQMIGMGIESMSNGIQQSPSPPGSSSQSYQQVPPPQSATQQGHPASSYEQPKYQGDPNSFENNEIKPRFQSSSVPINQSGPVRNQMSPHLTNQLPPQQQQQTQIIGQYQGKIDSSIQSTSQINHTSLNNTNQSHQSFSTQQQQHQGGPPPQRPVSHAPIMTFQRNPNTISTSMSVLSELEQRLRLLAHLEKYPGPLTNAYEYHGWNKMLFSSLRLFKSMSVLPGSKETANLELNQLIYGFLIKNVQLELFNNHNFMGTPRDFLTGLEEFIKVYLTPTKIRKDISMVVLKAEDALGVRKLNLDNVFRYNKEFSRLFELLRLVDYEDTVSIPDVISQYVTNASIELPILLEFSDHSNSIRSEFFEKGEQGTPDELKALQDLLIEFTTYLVNHPEPINQPAPITEISTHPNVTDLLDKYEQKNREKQQEQQLPDFILSSGPKDNQQQKYYPTSQSQTTELVSKQPQQQSQTAQTNGACNGNSSKQNSYNADQQYQKFKNAKDKRNERHSNGGNKRKQGGGNGNNMKRGRL